MKGKEIVFHGVLLVLLVISSGCTEREAATKVFRHEIDGPKTPWNHSDFDADGDKFTFAIFSDLNGGERPGVFEGAMRQLALLRPELILSVGDLIDGPSQDKELLAKEWDSFDSRADIATAPVFRVGGNHDLTGLALREVWTERYGSRYYHFVYKNVLFLVMDTEDHTEARMTRILQARSAAIEVMDEDPSAGADMEYWSMPERVTGAIGPEQSAYFQRVIQQNPDVRWTMLFMHKPVWQSDNQPGFQAIEVALSKQPYTLFNGHFHSYSQTLRNGRDYIMLGTTGGGQNPDNPMSFDHVTLVTVDDEAPTIVNLKLDGILDKAGAPFRIEAPQQD